MASERNLSDRLLRALKAKGGHWRKNPISRYGNSGLGDIVGCVNGRYVELELKAPGKYADAYDGLTSLQRHHGQEVIVNGGIWLCTDSMSVVEDLSGRLRLWSRLS